MNTKVHQILSDSSPEQWNIGPKYSFYFESAVWKTTTNIIDGGRAVPFKLTALRLLKMLPGLTLLTLLPPLTLLTHTAYTVAKILRYIAKWLKRHYNLT